MKIVLLLTGKTKEQYINDGIRDYERRVKKYISFEIFTLPGLKNSGNLTNAEVKLREGEKIISWLNSDDYVILLDEKGTEFATSEMAK
ncbi:MAG: 23S rRNA (pseudouridine(1915)-N(3))-methyltransferase RlmH, partial [Bacteroidales bacterium]|nr:23S rRNA (pseudouridine(1915)-N(3))-methyltransferase RlmH [Bacteroidales bacterium]